MNINTGNKDLKDLYNRALEFTKTDSEGGMSITAEELSQLEDIAKISGGRITQEEQKFLKTLESKISTAKIAAVGSSDGKMTLDLEEHGDSIIEFVKTPEEIKPRFDYLLSKGIDIKGKLDKDTEALFKEVKISNKQFSEIMDLKLSGELSSTEFKALLKNLNSTSNDLKNLEKEDFKRVAKLMVKFSEGKIYDSDSGKTRNRTNQEKNEVQEKILNLVSSQVKDPKKEEVETLLSLSYHDLNKEERNLMLNLLEKNNPEKFDNLNSFLFNSVLGHGDSFGTREVQKLTEAEIKKLNSDPEALDIFSKVLNGVYDYKQPTQDLLETISSVFDQVKNNHSYTIETYRKMMDTFEKKPENKEIFLDLTNKGVGTLEAGSTIAYANDVGLSKAQIEEIIKNQQAKGADIGDALAAVQGYAIIKEALDKKLPIKDPESLKGAAEKLKSGDLRIDDETKERLPENVAVYGYQRDTVYQKGFNINFPEQRALLLHELVHSGQDYSKKNGDHEKMETEAYLAQFLYLLNNEPQLNENSRGLSNFTKTAIVYAKAHKELENLKANGGTETQIKETTEKLSKAEKSFETELENHELYKKHIHKEVKTDGIKDR